MFWSFEVRGILWEFTETDVFSIHFLRCLNSRSKCMAEFMPSSSSQKYLWNRQTTIKFKALWPYYELRLSVCDWFLFCGKNFPGFIVQPVHQAVVGFHLLLCTLNICSRNSLIYTNKSYAVTQSVMDSRTLKYFL